MNATSLPPQTLTLTRCRHQDPGHALGLRSGDTLIAIDGKPWQGGSKDLADRFATRQAPLLLSFLRQDAVLSLLADSPHLGLWDKTTAPALPATIAAALPQPSAALCNWQIMVNQHGQYDLFALRPSWLALVMPPLWLAQARMFTWLTALAAAMALSLPGGAWLLAGVWVAAGLHLWRHGNRHLLQARLAEGYRATGVVAATSETMARQGWQALTPDARFRFDTPRLYAPGQNEQTAS